MAKKKKKPASTGFLGKYPLHVWWRKDDPSTIYAVSNDPAFHAKGGGHEGLWMSFSSNLRSANYHPANFNRCARALAAQGLPAPDEVPEYDRKLSSRPKWIAKLNKK